MRASAQTLAKGDAIDRAISRILTEICSVSSRITGRSFEDIGEGAQGTRAEKTATNKESLETELVTYMPFVKLATGKYLIGTHVR